MCCRWSRRHQSCPGRQRWQWCWSRRYRHDQTSRTGFRKNRMKMSHPGGSRSRRSCRRHDDQRSHRCRRILQSRTTMWWCHLGRKSQTHHGQRSLDRRNQTLAGGQMSRIHHGWKSRRCCRCLDQRSHKRTAGCPRIHSCHHLGRMNQTRHGQKTRKTGCHHGGKSRSCCHRHDGQTSPNEER